MLAGGEATFPEPDTSTKLKLFGVDVASFGDAHAVTEGALEVVFNDAVAGSCKKLVVSDDHPHLTVLGTPCPSRRTSARWEGPKTPKIEQLRILAGLVRSGTWRRRRP